MNSSELKKNSNPSAAQNNNINNNISQQQQPSQTLNTYKTVKNGNSIANSLINQLNNNVNNTLNIHSKQIYLNGKNKIISINNNNNNDISNNNSNNNNNNKSSNNTLITKSIFNSNKIKFNNNNNNSNEISNTEANNNNCKKAIPANKKSMSKENVNYLVSGSIAGAISRSATAGFERLTIIQQVQGMSSSLAGQVKYVGCIPALKEMVKREGLKSIWKGNLANIVKVSPNSGIRFLTYEFCKTQFLKNPSQDKMSVPQTMASGAMAGLTSTFFTYPLDVVRIRLSLQGSMGSSDYAAQRYNGITHGFFKIHSEEGIRGLYKGLGTSVLSIIPWVSINFGAYEFFRNYFKPIIERQIFINNNNNNNNNVQSSSNKNSSNNNPFGFDKEVQLNSSFEDNNNNKIRSTIQQQQQQPIPMTSVIESENELKKGINMICDFICGALSGAVTMTVCYPLDVLRRRMMVDGIGGNKSIYRNGWDAAKKILKHEGLPAFYHGIIPAYFKVVPTVAISFAVYEICKDLGGAGGNNHKKN